MFSLASLDQTTFTSRINILPLPLASSGLNCYHTYTEHIFHLACGKGQAEIAEMIIKNSAELNIELNAKDDTGWTAFHFACWNDRTSIVSIMISNLESVKIDLTAKTIDGKTGFRLAQDAERHDVVTLIRSKMPSNTF